MLNYKKEKIGKHEDAFKSVFSNNEFSGVIRDELQIIGTYSFRDDGHSIYLQELEILEANRGKGYGREFLLQLFKDNEQAEEIFGRSSLGAIGFYLKCNGTFPEAESYEHVCEHVRICRESDNDDEADANSMLRDFSVMRENCSTLLSKVK